MKSRDDAQRWIPLWCDKWMYGSTRIELQHDERAIWVDLLVMASKDSGFIRANPETEYPIKLLSGMLNATEELLERAIQRCIETGKIRQADNGVGYYLINWQEYQLTDRYKRKFQKNVEETIQSSPQTEHSSSKTEPIGEDRIGDNNIIKDDSKHCSGKKEQRFYFRNDQGNYVCKSCQKPFTFYENFLKHECGEGK